MATTREGGVYKDPDGEGFHNAHGEALDEGQAKAATDDLAARKDPKKRGKLGELDTSPVALKGDESTEDTGEEEIDRSRGISGAGRPASGDSRDRSNNPNAGRLAGEGSGTDTGTGADSGTGTDRGSR